MMALLIIGNGNDPPAHTPNLEFSDGNQITKQLVGLASHVCCVYVCIMIQWYTEYLKVKLETLQLGLPKVITVFFNTTIYTYFLRYTSHDLYVKRNIFIHAFHHTCV